MPARLHALEKDCVTLSARKRGCVPRNKLISWLIDSKALDESGMVLGVFVFVTGIASKRCSILI